MKGFTRTQTSTRFISMGKIKTGKHILSRLFFFSSHAFPWAPQAFSPDSFRIALNVPLSRLLLVTTHAFILPLLRNQETNSIILFLSLEEAAASTTTIQFRKNWNEVFKCEVLACASAGIGGASLPMLVRVQIVRSPGFLIVGCNTGTGELMPARWKGDCKAVSLGVSRGSVPPLCSVMIS